MAKRSKQDIEAEEKIEAEERDAVAAAARATFTSAGDVNQAAIDSVLGDGSTPMPLGSRCRVVNSAADNFYFEGVLNAADKGDDVFVVEVDRVSTGNVFPFTGRFAVKSGWTVHTPA